MLPYMGQVPGPDAPLPPRGGVSLGRGFLTQMDDFSKESLLRSSSREIPLWRSSGGRTPYSKQYFPQGICMPHSVLDGNIVKTTGICVFSVSLFELVPSQKHQKMNNSLSGRAHSLLKSVVSLRNSCPTTPTFHGGRGGVTPPHHHMGGSPPGGGRGPPQDLTHIWYHISSDGGRGRGEAEGTI